MNRLSPQIIFALVGLACLLTIYMFYSMVIRPKHDEIATLQSDLSTRQATLEQYRSAQAGLPQLQTDVEKLQRDQAEFIRALPLTADFGQVVDQIRSTVSANKATLKNLTFTPAAAGGANAATLPAGVRPMDIAMTINGEYDKQFQILRSLETQNRFTTISGVDLQSTQPAQQDGNTPAPAFNYQNPKLDSSFKLTVYTFDPTQAAPVGTAPAGTASAGTTPAAAAPAAPAPAAPAAPAGGTK